MADTPAQKLPECHDDKTPMAYGMALVDNPTPETLGIALDDAVATIKRYIERNPHMRGVQLTIRMPTMVERAKMIIATELEGAEKPDA